MVLSNGTSRAKRASSSAATQGGGSKKAGLYSSVGKDSWTNVAYGSTPGHCTMTLACMKTTRNPNTCASRPVGSLIVSPRFNC